MVRVACAACLMKTSRARHGHPCMPITRIRKLASGALVLAATAVSISVGRRRRKAPVRASEPQPHRYAVRPAAPPGPSPAVSNAYHGGFASGYEGPDRRGTDRGAPGGAERRNR